MLTAWQLVENGVRFLIGGLIAIFSLCIGLGHDRVTGYALYQRLRRGEDSATALK